MYEKKEIINQYRIIPLVPLHPKNRFINICCRGLESVTLRERKKWVLEFQIHYAVTKRKQQQQQQQHDDDHNIILVYAWVGMYEERYIIMVSRWLTSSIHVSSLFQLFEFVIILYRNRKGSKLMHYEGSVFNNNR